MSNKQLLDYVNMQISSGVAQEEIKNALLSKGWKEGDIEEAFVSANEIKKTSNFNQTPVSMVMPLSIKIFALLTSAGVILSAFLGASNITKLVGYDSGDDNFLSSLFLSIPVLILIVATTFKKLEWGRILLISLFVMQFFTHLISSVAFNVGLLFTISAGALKIIGTLFAFTSTSNIWFSKGDEEERIINERIHIDSLSNEPINHKNNTWSWIIPTFDLLTLAISLWLVFVVDLDIVREDNSLQPFLNIMYVVLVISIIFYIIEIFIFRKKFINTHSSRDVFISVFVFLRNIVFILNFIPFIQLFGLSIMGICALPYIIFYSYIIGSRYKALS